LNEGAASVNPVRQTGIFDFMMQFKTGQIIGNAEGVPLEHYRNAVRNDAHCTKYFIFNRDFFFRCFIDS